jgi:hypothetical protein
MRLPAGSANRIWRPPGPATTSLRKDSPALRRRSISASRSSTVRWMRLRPGVAASEGVARAPELADPDSSNRNGPRVTSARRVGALCAG